MPFRPNFIETVSYKHLIMDTWYYKLSIYRGHLQLDNSHSATITKLQSDLTLTIETPYLPLIGELWGIFRVLFEEKWPRYIESALY